MQLLGLLGIERPAPPQDARRPERDWRHQARRMIEKEVGGRPAREEWFAPLIRAAVHEPDPSFSRRYVEPALGAFGRLRVSLALLGYLETGTNPQRAGAALAWYWTALPYRRIRAGTTRTDDEAEITAVTDVRRQWHETALREFAANDDPDVRCCLLPGLPLHPDRYPVELHQLVADAVRIARTSDHEYLRHRVDIQVHT